MLQPGGEEPATAEDRRPPPELKRSPPRRITIDKIGVSAPVIALGLNPDGTHAVPPLRKPNLTSWYKHGPTPGQEGPSVILGHVDTREGPAVFARLKDLGEGDRVEIERRDGTVAVFEVERLDQTSKKEFPTDEVYGELEHPGLRMITCGGRFNEARQSHEDNIIAYARLVSARYA